MYLYLNGNLAYMGFLGLLLPIGSIKVPTIRLFYYPETPKYWDIQSSGLIGILRGYIEKNKPIVGSLLVKVGLEKLYKPNFYFFYFLSFVIA